MSRTAHRIFLLDGAGALVSALLLGVVLPPHADWFGAAPWALRVLAAYALGLLIADGVVAFGRPRSARRGLRGIAIANVVYLLFTAVVLASDGVALGTWGALYVAGEASIVAGLVVLEARAAGGDSHLAKAARGRRGYSLFLGQNALDAPSSTAVR